MKKLTVWLLLGAAIGGAYYNALGNGFVFDDYLLIVNNPTISGIASEPELVLSPRALGYRSLRTLSYVLDYRLGGMQPWIFHLNNILYHWIAACLVFLVASQLAENIGNHPTPNIALFAALLWALHPVQTEAVTYISGRRDILATLFFFLGFYAFLKFRARDIGRRSLWLLLTFLAYSLGLLSKETAVTLPLMMLCYDYVHEVRLKGVGFGWRYAGELGRGMVRTIWGHKYFYLPLLFCGAYFSWYVVFVVRPSAGLGWYGGSVVTNFLTVARIWVYYLYLL